MKGRGGLQARISRLEAADAAACLDCRPEYRWIASPDDQPTPEELAALEARRCRTCGRPVQVTFYRWKWDSDTDA